ncbi:MAG: segregation/condensation protein A [Saprospiraceae bacterium]|nr:segregation/condensation protein A [Saprospiraceae bacterium]
MLQNQEQAWSVQDEGFPFFSKPATWVMRSNDYLWCLKMDDQKYTTYTIKLPQFEGPFDLLLFFIERDELDIHNIPIAKITDDFLDYIRQMDALNIDLASEFILVAATLMRIKARMILPRKPVDEEGNEIDPREELVAKLLEYRRYKEILDEMRAMEEERSMKFNRGHNTAELKKIAEKALVDAELESVTMFKLLKAFERVMEQFADRQIITHTIVRFNYTIKDQQTYLRNTIQPGKKTAFETVFAGLENRIHAIITFLALLEMLNEQIIHLIQGEGANNFWLIAKDPSDEEE